MQVEIITPGKNVYSGNINYIKLPGSNGSFGILKNHAPIISTLGKGEIFVTDSENKNHIFKVDGGVVEVNQNKITVLAESIL
jgi:F-type H+-transporting ATPase subunit epsilon